MNMETRPTYTKNNYGVKSSSDMYRNIKGVHYRHLTADGLMFEQYKAEAKAEGLKTKMIKGELFIEVKE